MPPSPRITIKLDDERYASVCAQLGIAPPSIRFRDRLPRGTRLRGGASGQVFGLYRFGSNDVEVFTEIDQYGFDRLRAVNAELVITLLHELRHAWQHQSDDWKYGNLVADERDAEQYAQDHYHEWRGLLQVKREMFHRKLPG